MNFKFQHVYPSMSILSEEFDGVLLFVAERSILELLYAKHIVAMRMQ